MLLHTDVSSGDGTVGQVAAAVRRPYPVQRMCAYTIYRVTDDKDFYIFLWAEVFNYFLMKFYLISTRIVNYTKL